MSGSTSPLLLQALTGMNQQQDPALAAQLPKMQLAQALMQQGTDSSPTSKWGGISRLASALAGAYTFNQANEGVQDILKNRQQQTTDSLARMNAAGSPAPQPTPAQPTSQAPPVGSFAAKLGGSEAPNAGTVNPGGYSGQYQFGAARLASPGVGVYTPAPGEDLNANQWRGSFEIPGFPNVKTHADFLASPGAQNAVFATHLGDIDKTIANTPGAANMSQDGLRAVAHLGGSDGMQKFVAGGYDPADANGTHLSDYYNKFSQPTGGSTQVAGPGAPTGGGTSPAPSQYPPNFQRGLDMMHAAQQEMAASPYNQEIQQSGQRKIQEAAEIMKLETYQQTAPGTYQSSTGKPVFAPSPRLTTTPAGVTLASGSNGTTVIAPADNPGVAAKGAAAAQGTETGKQAVATAGKMVQLGHDSDSAIGNIDYGVNQLHQAAAGGINSGYFAPWLATAAAAGKSLGIDLHGLGIDPAAVGNVQSAQKTLGVVAGNILQNTIGKDSQITDAKIEHFIHTQPGIETDPEAIQRVLGWARSQFVYGRTMAMDAMKHIDPNSGMLPPGWQASFISRQGAFAPIYDPLSGEMKQPAGEGPPPVAAPSPTAATAAPPPSRSDIEAEMRKRGLLK